MIAFTYRIAEEIFQRFRGYVRRVVIAYGMMNSFSLQALLDLRRETEAMERAQGEAGAHARRHVQGEPTGAGP